MDFAKEARKSGCRLIHIVDMDALSGMTKNLDIYDKLTFIINVQVECAPEPALIMKLLSLKCRVVLPPSAPIAAMKEKKLLVARIPEDYPGSAEGFHDVVLDGASDESIRRFAALGKRVIIFAKDRKNVKEKVFGVISSS